jgi:ubiquinone/menaquinone biosynthesis C-methylase UbiE
MNNNYPIQDLAYPEINCRSLPIEDGSVDLYPSDQVLEHVGLNPQAVFDEAYRVLKLNGVAIVTTCLINPLHMEPTDYLRFTPYALHEMSEKAGFRDLESFTVGNEFDFLLQRLGGAGRKYRVVTRMVRDFASRYSRKKSPIFTGIILEE